MLLLYISRTRSEASASTGSASTSSFYRTRTQVAIKALVNAVEPKQNAYIGSAGVEVALRRMPDFQHVISSLSIRTQELVVRRCPHHLQLESSTSSSTSNTSHHGYLILTSLNEP